MNIFCTGNPQKKSIAQSLGCDHASLSSGWNFHNIESLDRLRDLIVEYNVFVNCSYIGPGVQLNLLNLVIDSWQEKDIKGHIINIGTTLENNPDDSQYCQDKLKLRERSLELSNETGLTGIKTTHIILGGINDGKIENSDKVSTDAISSTIHWAVAQEFRVPLIQLDGVK